MVNTFHGGIPKPKRFPNTVPGLDNCTLPAGGTAVLPLPDGAVLTVAEGDTVSVGSSIAVGEEICPVLSPIFGKISVISDNTVYIEALDGSREEEAFPPFSDSLDKIDPAAISERLRLCAVISPLSPGGVFSQCLAAAKLSSEQRIRLVVDCTSPTVNDFTAHSLILHRTRELIGGIKILMRASMATEAVIIADNSSIEVIRRLESISDGKAIRLSLCEAKHPMHDPKLLTYLAVRRELPPNTAPLSLGCLPVDAEACVFAFIATVSGKRQTHRFISVTDQTEKECRALPFGALVTDLISLSDGEFATKALPLHEDIGNGNLRIDHNIRCIYPINKKEANISFCIGCDECESACPMYLPVARLVRAGENNIKKLYDKYDFRVCIDCGCCSAVCPSGIEIRKLIRGGVSCNEQSE